MNEHSVELSRPAHPHHRRIGLSNRLAEVEVLHLLNFGPKDAGKLLCDLRMVFGCSISPEELHTLLVGMESGGLIQRLNGADESGTGSQVSELYCATCDGIRLFESAVEELTHITLTMQLRLSQELVRA